MEPHATIAAWEGEKLTLWTSNQMIAWGKRDVAKTLGIPAENVRLLSPYVGGGFGASCSCAPMPCLRRWAPRPRGAP